MKTVVLKDAGLVRHSNITKMLKELLAAQKAAYFNHPEPSFQERLNHLKSLKAMLLENRDLLTSAIEKDYSNRSWHETTFAEFIGTIGAIDYMMKHLKKWMKPQKRHVDQALFPGAKNRLIPQPLGVVGIIVPWNFPVNLAMIPVATALASGNRVMVKMSENSRNLAKALISIISKYFSEDKLLILDENGGVGVEFSKLPFDLLMFTGSIETGKSVMAAAAQNLTPVILELGGKSPTVIDPEYPIGKAVKRIIYAKQFNAGQVCLNVDYVFVHESQLDHFIASAKQTVKKMVPDINHSNYSSIIDKKSLSRLESTLLDAANKGAKIINLNEQELNREHRKFPMHLVLNPSVDMEISEREIFGPILLVRTYQTKEDVITFVNANNRPLGFYIFSENRNLVAEYISRVMSGGVCVNETMMHVFQDDLPFGGVGHSGMGHYHGKEGFESFSKMRPVFYQTKNNAMGLLAPPYRSWLTKAYNMLVSLKS